MRSWKALLVMVVVASCSSSGEGQRVGGSGGIGGGAGGLPDDGAASDVGGGGTGGEGSPDGGAVPDVGSPDGDAGDDIAGDSGGDLMTGDGGTDVSANGTVVKQLAGGDGFTCALTEAGGVKCWGDGSWGSLGDGNSQIMLDSLTHVATDVVGLTSGVKKIAVAGWNACALKDDGLVVCWGQNYYGELAIDQAMKGSSAPVPLSGVTSTAIDVAITYSYVAGTHGCIVDSGSNMRCWGSNSAYQLGVVAPAMSGPLLSNPTLTGYREVTGGGDFTCGLTNGGGVECWGNDANGQLGNGMGGQIIPNTAVKQQVVGLADGIVQIVANVETVCALTSAGGVKCWGSGVFGQLGPGLALDPHTGGVSIPNDVQGLTSGVVRLAGGVRHYCALMQDRTVKCWGYDQNGQLGDQPATIPINHNVATPTTVLDVDNVIAVGTGVSQTCAAIATGGVKCWGSGTASGSLMSTNQLAPQYVKGL